MEFIYRFINLGNMGVTSMKGKIASVFVAITLAGVPLLAGPAYADYIYHIRLLNGGTFTVRHYELKDQNIVLYKYGGYISFSRSEVAKIDKEFIDGDISGTTSGEFPTPEKRSVAGKKQVAAPKDERAKKIAQCQRSLKSAQQNVLTYCGQAADAKIARAPNLPTANRTTVSEATGKQFQDHVQSKVAAFKASSYCDYYKRKAAELETECGEK